MRRVQHGRHWTGQVVWGTAAIPQVALHQSNGSAGPGPLSPCSHRYILRSMWTVATRGMHQPPALRSTAHLACVVFKHVRQEVVVQAAQLWELEEVGGDEGQQDAQAHEHHLGKQGRGAMVNVPWWMVCKKGHAGHAGAIPPPGQRLWGHSSGPEQRHLPALNSYVNLEACSSSARASAGLVCAHMHG